MNAHQPMTSYAPSPDGGALQTGFAMNDLLQVRVARIVDETDRIRMYVLVRPDRSPLPAFTAGAHVAIRLPSGLIRHYSLANNPSETHRYILGIQRDANSTGGSSYIHASIREGDSLFIGAPVNHFAIRDAAAPAILIAGGIGITPILSMAHQLQDRGTPFEIIYLTRSMAETAFRAEVAAAFAGKVTLHHDRGLPERQFDLTGLLRDVRPGTDIYCCGPSGLMTAVKNAAGHWPQDRVHFEYFSNDTPLDKQGDQPFEVALARSGLTVTVNPGETILQVLLRHNVDVPYSCDEGTCGTCITKVLEGIPDHRDVVLDPSEKTSNGVMTVCCSRAATSRLVLDL
ncbi:MAG TPA: PDR/VanB family oxidoreductase [Pseudolabrys sp.]|nr:PDR/VanB family oxidoreductase [Pseudolabrys sp.]